jgi:serpin B
MYWLKKLMTLCFGALFFASVVQAGDARPLAEFGNTLHAKVAQQKDGNCVLSPYSAYVALSMATVGATGQTSKEMLAVLGAKSEVALRQFNAELLALKMQDKECVFTAANSLWTREGFKLDPSYIADVEQTFQAKATDLDFSSDRASPTINKWVSDHTNKKIDNIIPSKIPADAVMYLINAAYLKAPWTKAFTESLTKVDKFRLAKGTVQIPFMDSHDAGYAYAKGESESAVLLPLGKNRELSFIIVLPDGVESSAQLATRAASNSSKLIEKLLNSPDEKVALRLPKFRVEFKSGLKDALDAMGVKLAFGGGNFDGISKQFGDQLVLSDVVQKTFLDVNEKGIEAAAATVVEVSREALILPPKTKITVDRPFNFYIVEEKSGAVLFQGSIVNPKG